MKQHRSEASLHAAYDARRCALCGAAASVTCVGSDAVYVDQMIISASGRRIQRVLCRAPIADIDLCLTHAAERWPWASEKPRAKRRARA